LLLFFKRKSRLEKGRKKEQMPERQHATWGELLREAVEKPGRMLEPTPPSATTASYVEGDIGTKGLAENRKGNPKPERGPHLCRCHFHSESWSARFLFFARTIVRMRNEKSSKKATIEHTGNELPKRRRICKHKRTSQD
jgi:hypothetical protein